MRYRYDEEQEKRFKTIELVVDEIRWTRKTKPVAGETIVGVRVEWGEKEIAGLVKRAGGKWNRQERVWEMRYDRAIELGLRDRLVLKEAYNSRGR